MSNDAPEIYRNRTSGAWCRLDDAHFNWRNKQGSDMLFDVGGYCLDAPEQIPAGSMKRYEGTGVRMTLTARYDPLRHLTPEQRAAVEARMDQIVSDICKEWES